MHSWPYSAQVPASVPPVPVLEVVDVPVVDVPVVVVLAPVLVVVPPSPPSHVPHVPFVLPSATTQGVPGQQSASIAQAPHAATHCVAAHTNGGLPLGFGTQGMPLQQFAPDAHASPEFAHCIAAHRGTPTASSLHVSSFSQLPLQQSHDALHDIVASLQTSPSGLQPIGFLHVPTMFGAVMSHVTGWPEPPGKPAEPQQSASCVHRSPTTWQPLAG